ncbi:alternate phospholipase [Phytophthora cinnamomi]|uniref:alternate phospholipase n=1 Tax=Phytophthora cinnamomi TaxID=4785 RepID=UPI00355969A9|nr:alternate phospholipase [Phytophthora cinnamomi]
MASSWRQQPHLDPWAPPSPPPLLEEAAPKPVKTRFSRRSTRAKSHARQQAQHVELEVEELAEQRERDKRRSLLASMFGERRGSRSSSDASASSSAVAQTQTLVQREKAFRLVRHGSDPLLNDAFYATQVQVGNFVKMGWLTKQGHMWKSWKTRFFVLFSDGTFAYYKNKGRKKIKGCMQLNDGVVSVQHVDIRLADKAYVFQIEKGFYKLLCYCCSQFEAELWVAALRSVRRVAPPCYEMDLTATEEKAGSNAVTRHLNKIFITDKEIAKRLAEFKVNVHDHSYAAIHNFIVELDDAIIDRHHLEFYQDPEIELLPGNELVRLIRRHVEDRVFIPLYAEAYASLETEKVKTRRSNLEQNLKVLKLKTQADFGISKDLSVCDWKQAISVVNMLDCVSLPTHKFEVVLSAGKAITELIAQYNGELFEVSDEMLTAIFRHRIEVNKTASYLGSQMPNNSWKIVEKDGHLSRSARSGSVEDLIRGFSSLNEVVDRLSAHVRNGVKSHGLIRLFIMVLLFRQSETKEADDLRDRFYSLISLNIDVSKDKLVPLIEEYTSLYKEYFSLRGAGNYAVNYQAIPEMMSKVYGMESGFDPVSTEPFPIHLHRFIDAERWAEQCTLLTHAVFCKIPVRDFIPTGSKKKHSVEFTSVKRWFQHISAYVINAVLVQNTPEERAEVISFYLKVADYCISLHNHDTLASILYALQSTAVQRLRKTIDCLSLDAKKMMNEMQLLSDKGCREMNRLMRKTANPSMPYIGLYLQGFVGLNELPAFDKEGLVNANRLRRMGELSMEILHRQSVAYTLRHDEDVNKLLHVSLPYSSEESRYARSLELEPREADAMPLSDRGSCTVIDDDVDLESEVRESIGGDGTFGFRQWIRKQQVVHRNRSRSSVIALYEWV